MICYFYTESETIVFVIQWRSKGGGTVRSGRHFCGAAKLRLYLKIWKGKSILRGRNSRRQVTKEP